MVERAAILILVLGLAPAAFAQSFPGAREAAEALVGSDPEFQSVPHPDETERPTANHVVRSVAYPIAVQFDDAALSEEAERALAVLEDAYLVLRQGNFPEPMPDGGFGDTGEFDFYLGDFGLPRGAHSDGPIQWSYFDAVSSFATMDPNDVSGSFEACVIATYAEAVYFGQDPAEAPAWRRATGAWIAWMLTGHFGCSEDVTTQQREPWRSWISGSSGEGTGGALFLALLSARFDRGTGTFVRELWQFARQRTRERPEALRGTPDLWEVFEVAMEHRNLDYRDVMETFAIARFFTRDRSEAATMQPIRLLPEEASVPIAETVPLDALPEHLEITSPPLGTFGSQYTRVDTIAAPRGTVLQIWLQGEYGVDWSLVAIALDDRGRELSRMIAPPNHPEPRSYLPIRVEPEASHVLMIITNLSSRLPDADVPDENVRAAKIIVDIDSPN